MDSTTANIFKMVEAKKMLPDNNGKPHSTKKHPRHKFRTKSRFQIIKEKLEALEWKPELPEKSRAFIPKGWRGATLRWIGFNLRRSQVDRAIIEKIIRQAANEVCLPSLTERQANSLIEGIFKEPS